MARYGSDDNNVPPWNLRRMARLIDEQTHSTSSVIVSEVPGEGHWWGTAMNAPEIQSFYSTLLSNNLPKFPEKFTVTTINPDTSGIKKVRSFLNFQELVEL
jgi:hypothetical protein